MVKSDDYYFPNVFKEVCQQINPKKNQFVVAGEAYLYQENKPDQGSKQVLICQNRTCLRQGSKQVKAAFQNYPLEGVEIISSGCLGECGNGVMVLILPDKIWYWHIQPYDVELIVNQHLKDNIPVKEFLDPKFHPQEKADQ